MTAIRYGLAAFSKPIFPLATGIGWIVTAHGAVSTAPQLMAALPPPHSAC